MISVASLFGVEFDMIVQGILQWSEQDFTCEKNLSDLIAEMSRITLCELNKQDKWSPEIQFAKRKIQCKSCLKFGHLRSKCRSKWNKPDPSKSAPLSSQPECESSPARQQVSQGKARQRKQRSF